MPAETRMYVPKLQAVKNIVANPERYRTELPLIENHPYFQTVLITRDIDVELAARLAGVKLEDFKALNPSMHRPIIMAAGTPQILLPWDNAAVFQRNFEAYTKGQYASWTAWTVPTTMSVTAIAQRVGMSEGDLRSMNSIPPNMMVRAGSALIVPRSASNGGDVASHVADNGHVALTPEIVTRRTVVKAGKKESTASIAQRYRVSAADVANWNDDSAGAAFKVGQQVVLYLPVRAGKGRASASASGAGKQAASSGSRSSASNAKAVTPSKRGGTPSKKKR